MPPKLAACLFVLCACADDEPNMPPVDPNDLDGDGIPNDLDVCPRANDPLQHDEDGDRIGDRCDVCPTVVDPLQSDTTELDNLQFEDGVGDLCDPQPGRAGTKIGALHTFAADNSTSWLGGGWTIASDRARAETTAMWQAKQTESGGVVTVMAHFSTVTWAGNGVLTVIVDGDGVSGGFRCEVLQDTDGDGIDELVAVELGGETKTMNLGTIVPDMPLTVSALRAGDIGTTPGVFYCKATYDSRTREVRLTAPSETIVGQYAFGSTGAVSEVTSVIVYTSPPPCLKSGPRACPK